MKTFIIATVAPDLHAAIVAVALQQLGERCVRWMSSDLAAQHVCVELGAKQQSMHISSADINFASDIIDQDSVLWNRRIARQLSCDPDLCAADKAVAESENALFLKNFVTLLNLAPHRINDFYSASRAENKTFQLLAAQRCGLAIPNTIVTNSPERIRKFVKCNERVGVVAKPFFPTVWKAQTEHYVNRSALVNGDMLPSDKLLQACPMIFQNYVEKDFEVRITCFDKTLVAARLNSQQHPSSQIDWRAVSVTKLGIEPIAIPTEIEDRCIKLLESLDLKFGCIDMIVTPTNEWVFLEINQMGQFLWIEEVNGDFPMLDLFLQLLTGTLTGDKVSRKFGLSFQQVNLRARSQLESESRIRLPTISSNFVNE
jgi:glutathione synthase/RimK-type ligase-like ATP-grasp enzyme